MNQLNLLSARQARLQQQAATGQRLRAPEDDPAREEIGADAIVADQYDSKHGRSGIAEGRRQFDLSDQQQRRGGNAVGNGGDHRRRPFVVLATDDFEGSGCGSDRHDGAIEPDSECLPGRAAKRCADHADVIVGLFEIGP